MFNSPRLDDNSLAALYDENYYFFLRSAKKELPRAVRTYQRTVSCLAGKLPAKHALDIGCARGYFPAILQGLGWNAQGVEISESAASYASKFFGLEVYVGTIEEYAQYSNGSAFSLVTAIDVIEHVPCPRTFLESIALVVQPGGYLIVDTPNGNARNIKHCGKRWRGFNPFHILIFNPDNLRTLIEECGFSVETMFSYENKEVQPDSKMARGRLRDAIKNMLSRVGLLGIVARLLSGIRLAFNKYDRNPRIFLDKAVAHAANAKSWRCSPDARLPMAATNEGDNLVVIARRRPG